MISVAALSMFNINFASPILMAGAPWSSLIFLMKTAAADEPTAPGTVQYAATDTQSATWHVVATRGANRYRVVGGIPNVWQPVPLGITLIPGSVLESGEAPYTLNHLNLQISVPLGALRF